MRVNNVDEKTSLQLTVILAIVIVFYVVLYVILYKFSGATNFFEWAKVSLAALNAETDWEMKIYLWILTVIGPIASIIGIIRSFVYRQTALQKFNIGLNLKFVDFKPERVDFVFTQPQYNFTCGYDDIENLNMNIKTVLIHTKNGTRIAVEKIKLSFKVLNGKTFELTNTAAFPMKFCYKIADFGRRVKNFSYNFSGFGVQETIKESLDDYLRTGYKQILATPMEHAFKWMSIMFFGIFIFFVCAFMDIITNSIDKGDYGLVIMFSPFTFFAGITLVLNIVLVLDKINDRKYGTDHKSKELIGKIPCELIFAVEVIVFAVLSLIIFKPLIFTANDRKILDVRNSFQELFVNQPTELSNMRKDEIYSYRKAYVKDSIFASDNYEPDNRVFGAIEDYKPWWGEQKCRPLNYSGDYHESIEGKSKQSIQINNPNALVGLSSPYIPWDVEQNADFCNSEYSSFIPYSLKYSKKDNLIVAEYEVSKEFPNIYVNISGKGYRYPIQLSGLNALDFGYKYVYAFDTKNIEMTYPNNITQTPEMFRDYLHVGGSCGYAGGCNNISPMQNDKMISVTGLPAEINLKLWKKQPHDKYSKADMYYRIIFIEQ